MATSYTSNKKIGALDSASTPLAATNEIVINQNGDILKTPLSAVEAKVFDAKTAITNPSGTEVVVVRQTDNTLRQVALSDIVPALNITNAKISASAAIEDTKLATINTAGKVANSATTATSSNTASAIVARDSSGNFTAGTITATLSGNASTATLASSVADGSVATSKITDSAVTTAKIADANVTTAKIADANVTTAKIADANVTTAKLASATQQALIPAGAVMPFAMNSAPSGWLAADGAAVDRTTYAALFAAIGTTHGAGNGSTTFNLPNLQGIFVRGSGQQTISGIGYGANHGAKQQDAFQGHWHNWHWANGGRGTQSASGSVDVISIVDPGSGPRSNRVQNAVTDTANGTPRTAEETRPANIALLYCIKF